MNSVENVFADIPLSKVLIKGKNKGAVYSLMNQGYVDWANVQKDGLKQTKQAEVLGHLLRYQHRDQ